MPRKKLADWAGSWERGDDPLDMRRLGDHLFVYIGIRRNLCRLSSGGRTASGERLDPNAMTAAHRTGPLGSRVTVTSHPTGRSVTVRINDRGPFVKGRCIDLSTSAARVLGMTGTATVSLR